MPETIRTIDGSEAEIEHVKPLTGGGARFDITAEDGRRWRLDVTRSGNAEVVTSWDRDGNLADVELPDWVDDILVRLQ